jgi:hypothetical protein
METTRGEAGARETGDDLLMKFEIRVEDGLLRTSCIQLNSYKEVH